MQTGGSLLPTPPPPPPHQHAQVGRSRVYIQLPVAISVRSGGAHPNTAIAPLATNSGSDFFFFLPASILFFLKKEYL